jgi:hypothetical protein
MIQITYNGVDISGSVSVNRCYHDMYAGDQSDTMHLRVNDVANLWDAWAPAAGDEIRIDYGPISTGTMFVSSTIPKNGIFDITAQSAPMSGFDKQNKAWQKVRLLQIGAEIAKRNGLSFHSYGVDDRLYSYLLQAEGDFQFLNRLARLEGCAIIIYDRKLIMYSEQEMEAQAPAERLVIAADGDYKYQDRRANLFGSCVVQCGMYSGSFSVENGSSRALMPEIAPDASSNEDAARFAKNLLRYANKGCYGGHIRSAILPGYAPASTVELSNARAPSWNGSVFIEHIRNDYGRGESKIFFRKPLEGY